MANRDKVPDHSWLSKTRSRLPHEVHEKVFGWVLDLVAERGLVKGERIGVDGSTMEANAALRTIVRRDNGETYREMLTRMAKESGIATPTIDDLVRLDRKRKGKKLSNEDWTSPTDPDAKIARMKDGTTHLAYKPEHAVDLDTGVIVAAPIHPADEGDTTTLDPHAGRRRRRTSPRSASPRRRKSPANWSPTRAITHARSEGPRRRPLEDAHRRADAEPRAICAGTATRRRARRSMPTATGCDRASARRPCASAARSSSAASPMSWNAAACAGHGCAAAKTSTSAIWSMSPATISAS